MVKQTKLKLKQTQREKQCKQKGKKSILIRKIKKAPKQTLAFDLGPKD